MCSRLTVKAHLRQQARVLAGGYELELWNALNGLVIGGIAFFSIQQQELEDRDDRFVS